MIIDDEKDTTILLKKALYRQGFNIIIAESATDSINKLTESKPDLVLLDLVLPDMNGLVVLEEIKRLSPETEVIIITAFPSISHVVEAMKLGASDFLVKPFNLDELVNILRKTLEEARLRRNAGTKVSQEVLKALSNPIRRRIAIYLLNAGARRFSEIAKSIDIDNISKLSFHLRVLSDTGIVRKNKENLYLLTVEGTAIVEKLVYKLESGGYNLM